MRTLRALSLQGCVCVPITTYMSLPSQQRPNQYNLMLSPATIHANLSQLRATTISSSNNGTLLLLVTNVVLILVKEMREYSRRMREAKLPRDLSLGSVYMFPLGLYGKVHLIWNWELVLWRLCRRGHARSVDRWNGTDGY